MQDELDAEGQKKQDPKPLLFFFSLKDKKLLHTTLALTQLLFSKSLSTFLAGA